MYLLGHSKQKVDKNKINRITSPIHSMLHLYDLLHCLQIEAEDKGGNGEIGEDVYTEETEEFSPS